MVCFLLRVSIVRHDPRVRFGNSDRLSGDERQRECEYQEISEKDSRILARGI